MKHIVDRKAEIFYLDNEQIGFNIRQLKKIKAPMIELYGRVYR